MFWVVDTAGSAQLKAAWNRLYTDILDAGRVVSDLGEYPGAGERADGQGAPQCCAGRTGREQPAGCVVPQPLRCSTNRYLGLDTERRNEQHAPSRTASTL
jgi:hypothetical protein